jgi:outer membrane receptor protein involved in Fe transport
MKKFSVVFCALAVLAFSFVLCAPQAAAQAVYGSIFGTLTDPSGAAVAGAKVTVTSASKGTTFETTTNTDGNYSVTHLIPDLYNIRAEGSGFKAFETKGINVSADAGSRVDGKFEVGGSTETVEVTSEAPQLTTDRADVATTFNDKYVQDVPILNRNFTSLQLMAPGSQKMVGWSHAATENPQGSLQIFTQGQHFSGTAFELDGTDNQDPILGIIVVNPNLDAVTEAKVSLQNYDAEFGKAVSSVVTAQTKSGSNQLHGSGFLFRRSDAQQARDPFTQYKQDPITHRFIPPSRWVQFGGTVGGPIIKDKLFFFGDYQGTRQTNGVSGTFTVPTTRVAQSCNPATNATSATPGFCDLSEYSAPGAGIAGGGVVFDPTTGDPNTGVGRTAFAGNLIPIARISPAAGKILAAFPAPQTNTLLNNLIGSGSGPFTQNSFDTRIDYAANPSLNVFGRFSLDYFSLSGKGVLGAVGGPGNGLLGLAGSSITHNYSLASGFTKTLSSSLLTDFRFGYFKYNPQTQKPTGGAPMTAFGIPNANTSDPKTAGLGSFLLGSDPISGQGCTTNNGGQGCVISSFGDGLGVARCNCPLTESEQQFQFVNNWTKLRGNHQIKFGADIRYAMNLRIPSDNNRTGEYNFSPEATSNGGAGGLDLGSFLLGQVTSFARYVNNPALTSSSDAAERQKRWFFYGQDTWRVTPKLTLNYGLRWEIYFPESVKAKGAGGFANIIDLNGTGAIRVGGVGKYGLNGNVDNYFKAFAPRVGIAYSVTPKTVVRLGYGRSYDIGVFGSNFGHTVTQNLPVLLKQNVDATAFNPNAAGSKVPVFILDNGPVAATFPAVPSDGLIPFAALGGQVSGVHIRPTRQVLPLVDSWNATVQHQVTTTISAEVAFVGSKGTHGFAGDGPNYDVNPVSIVGHGTALTQNQRRPLFPNIPFDLGNFYGNDASSSYKAFEAKIEKRFTNGLQFVTHYTFSHANGYDSNYYAISHPIAYGPVDFNRNHVFVFNTVYELPFGKGKKYMGNSSRAMDYAVGGWQVSNTTNWSSGLPWTPSFAECGPEEDVGICRPNKGTGTLKTGAGSLDPISHTITYFTPVSNIVTSPGVFADPGFSNLGNLGRNTYHGPSGFYSDLSAVKKFRVTERLSAQFRVDAFNIFNHPVYAFSQNNGANGCIDCQGGNNGKITALEGGTTMRQLQFAIRFDF